MLALYSVPTAFQAPLPVAHANVVRMSLESMPGKYSLNNEVFDPLGLATIFDAKWVREAELKHGRICMLAFAGYVAVDLGIKLPDHDYSSLDAHEKAVSSGALVQVLAFVSLLEILTGIPAANYMMNGGDREPVRITLIVIAVSL